MFVIAFIVFIIILELIATNTERLRIALMRRPSNEWEKCMFLYANSMHASVRRFFANCRNHIQAIGDWAALLSGLWVSGENICIANALFRFEMGFVEIGPILSLWTMFSLLNGMHRISWRQWFCLLWSIYYVDNYVVLWSQIEWVVGVNTPYFRSTHTHTLAPQRHIAKSLL